MSLEELKARGEKRKRLAECEGPKGPYKELEDGAIIGPTKVLQIALVVDLLNEAFSAGEKNGFTAGFERAGIILEDVEKMLGKGQGDTVEWAQGLREEMEGLAEQKDIDDCSGVNPDLLGPKK